MFRISIIATLVMLSPQLHTYAAQIEKTFKFNMEDMHCDTVVIDGETMLTYSYNGLVRWALSTGAPEVPSMQVLFSVPFNATNISINASEEGVKESESARLLPSPLPKANDAEDAEVVYVADAKYYNLDALYPAQAAVVSSPSYLFGDNMTVRVNLFPLRYNPVRGTITMSTTINVRLSYDLLDSEPKGVLSRNNEELRREEREIVKSMVENPEDVDRFSRQLPNSRNRSMEATRNALQEFKYLIVTTREQEHAFRRIAALKRQTGVSVAVKCIEDILEDSVTQGGDKPQSDACAINDKAGKLRQFLRDAWQNHSTQYVFLGGRDVPFRKGFHQEPKDGLGVMNVPTDLYMSDLNTDWNPTGSGNQFGNASLYTRFGGSCVFDLAPELFVGRLMGNTAEDIENYTDKLFIYQLNPGLGNTDYLKKGFFFEYGNMHGSVASYMTYLNYSIIRRQEIGENSITGASLISEINNLNPGFISFHCHGSHRALYIGNYSENGHDTDIIIQALDNQSGNLSGILNESENGLDNLNNRYKPNVMYTTSCDTEPFDYPESNDLITRNFGDSFTCGKRYGGIAYLGNTRTVGTPESEQLEEWFAKHIMHSDMTIDTKHCIGSSEAYSKLRYDSLYYAMVHNLIGDPEVKLWTTQPIHFSDGIQVNRLEDCIQILNIGEQAIMTACSNDGTVVKQYGGNNWECYLSASPNSTVTLMKDDHIPYIAPLVLQNTTISNSQYVIANDVVAGRNVDANRMAGDVTIADGVDYEIAHQGSVTLGPGFKVENGAKLTIKYRDF